MDKVVGMSSYVAGPWRGIYSYVVVLQSADGKLFAKALFLKG